MKKILFTLMCLATMVATGTGLKAQGVTIVLMPGWTWISIPSTDTLDFQTAFGSFTPAVGDIVKSQWGSAIYRGDGQWRGQVSQFYPGYGYHYYSTRTMPVFLTFNVQQPTPSVAVTTSEPMMITAVSAMGGGEVTTTDGTYIIVKGLCWAVHENPTTNDDFYQEAESGVGSFSLSMTGLNINTTYYVRAYAVTANGTVYGDQKTFTTRDGIPEVSTDSVTDILGNSATGGGNITDNEGLTITARGVCWSTSHNPTLNDNHTSNGSGTGNFSSSITGLSLNTTYYVRAYASTSQGTGYGEEVSFTTQSSSVGLYVDLGLPSGTLWAACNVGAEYPEAYGNYFAWGETQPKSTYNWSTYQYCNGGYGWNTLTKYCNNPEYGYNGFTDNLTTLLPEDDAATANWGDNWRMPTKEEIQELYNNTTVTWTTQNGVYGSLFTASNGNSLFLPAAGCRWDGHLYNIGSNGEYWSSSLSSNPYSVWFLLFNSSSYWWITDDPIDGSERPNGYPVRAVRCKNSVINVTVNPAEGGTVSGGGTYMDHTSCTVSATATEGYAFTCWTEDGVVVSTDATYTFIVNGNRTLVANFSLYVDLGLPSGLLWATCNVGADNPEDYGDYFAWGETQPKDTYDWSTYQYCMGGENTLTKYCTNSNYGYNGFTDNLTTLLLEDDAATANWGSDWRMPTKEEWQELFNNTTVSWTTQNGVNGRLFTASNGNSLFLPAAGYLLFSNLYSVGSHGNYWSSSLNTGDPNCAWNFNFDLDGYDGDYYYYRRCGRSVRAVRSSR